MNPADPALAAATRADLDALPENVVGEIIDGVLYTTPRPRAGHALVETTLAAELDAPYRRGRGGPGGWWILVEPGIELPDAAEIVPDLAGWRRDRLPNLPEDTPIQVVPDWVCEILSPGSRRHDQVVKRPFYARVGVAFMWIVDLAARTLSTSKLVDGHWLELSVHAEGDPIRVEPFPEVEISINDWFGDHSS